MNEHGIVRETLVGVLVQPEVEHGAAANHAVAEVTFQVGAAEGLHRVAGQLFELGISLVPQVKTRQLVIPRLVGEAGNGPAIDLFLFRAQFVLIEKHSQPLVKAGVVGIAIDLLPQHAQRLRNFLHFR